MPETNVLVWSDGTVRMAYPEDIDSTVQDRIDQFDSFIESAIPNYPNDLNSAIAEHLNEDDSVVARTTSIHDPDQGVTPEIVEWADVVVWWGHLGQVALETEPVERVERAVREDGLGLIVLHSANDHRPFTGLIGTSGEIADTGHGESESIAVAAPDHPIAAGVEPFEIPEVETYDEPFDIPEPDTVVFRSSFSNGHAIRSGVTFGVENGRVFYFRPGDEQWRIYHDEPVRRIVANAVDWAAPE